MTKPPSLDHILQSGRLGLTPSDSMQHQVLARLAQSFPELAPAAPATPPGFWQLVKATGGGGAALGAFILATGFVAGYASKSDSTVAHQEERSPDIAAAEAAPELAGSEPEPRSEPLEKSSRGTPRAVETDRDPARREAARSPSRASPRPSETPSNVSNEGAPEDELKRELLLLRRAERAVRSNNPDVALALLDELDREHPRAVLAEERTATRVMAACRAGGDRTLENADAFLKAHPRSVYTERIRLLCARDPSEKSAPGVTDAPLLDTNGG